MLASLTFLATAALQSPQLRGRAPSPRMAVATAADLGECAVLPVLGDDEWRETIDSAEGPVGVDFFADWCGPCKLIEPHLQQLACDTDRGVRVVKAKLDESPSLRVWLLEQGISVSALPTNVLFKDGKPVRALAGAFGYSTLARFVDDGGGDAVDGKVVPTRTAAVAAPKKLGIGSILASVLPMFLIVVGMALATMIGTATA